jgi:hypothetical protein
MWYESEETKGGCKKYSIHHISILILKREQIFVYRYYHIEIKLNFTETNGVMLWKIR